MELNTQDQMAASDEVERSMPPEYAQQPPEYTPQTNQDPSPSISISLPGVSELEQQDTPRLYQKARRAL
ncbi:hypothetical protein BGX26_009271 [Mortierella sp. AD094]|nr:hypothetical protein BGX26_009271 [Mortierella sp. AD094]